MRPASSESSSAVPAYESLPRGRTPPWHSVPEGPLDSPRLPTISARSDPARSNEPARRGSFSVNAGSRRDSKLAELAGPTKPQNNRASVRPQGRARRTAVSCDRIQCRPSIGGGELVAAAPFGEGSLVVPGRASAGSGRYVRC
eukprot:5828421-Prymnesium_polylepis.1